VKRSNPDLFPFLSTAPSGESSSIYAIRIPMVVDETQSSGRTSQHCLDYHMAKTLDFLSISSIQSAALTSSDNKVDSESNWISLTASFSKKSTSMNGS